MNIQKLQKFISKNRLAHLSNYFEGMELSGKFNAKRMTLILNEALRKKHYIEAKLNDREKYIEQLEHQLLELDQWPKRMNTND